MRKKALKWWGRLTIEGKTTAVEAWKLKTNDFRKRWPNQLIFLSDSTIEKIYTEKN